MNSDSEVEEETPWKGVSATIILMNAFDPFKLNTISTAYNATCELVRKTMRHTSNHQIGICLYGTKESNLTNLGVEGVWQIFPLTEPSLDEFKKLKDTCLNSCGQAQELKLSDVLWHCGKMFANCKKLLSSKTVVILTRMDIPPAQADQEPALKRVEDLVISGITLKIINVSEKEYHVDKFYDDFMKEAYKGSEYKMAMPVWDISEIVKLMYHHTHRHIAIARLSLEIGEGFSIGVGIYSLLKSQTKPKKVYTDKDTNQIVTSVVTNYKESDTSEINNEAMDVDIQSKKETPLLKSETLYYQVFGEEKIHFSDDEMKKLRNPFGPPQIKLLGFKPVNTLCKEKWFLRGSYFLYPSEDKIEGSTVAFKALHQACVEMSTIAICVLCTRVNSRPHIVALSPCSKPLGLDVKIGFDIIYIPFVENLKNIPVNEECEKHIEEADKLVMKSILENLIFDYVPDTFENPTLNSLLSAVEALALEKEDIEDFQDTTKADPSKFRQIDAELFEELFGPFGATAIKRPASGSNSAGGKKERITETIDEDLLKSRLYQHKVEKYTVSELKQILKANNVQTTTTGLKKNELIHLVYDNLGKEN